MQLDTDLRKARGCASSAGSTAEQLDAATFCLSCLGSSRLGLSAWLQFGGR